MYATRDDFDISIIENPQYYRVKKFWGRGRWDSEETKSFWLACEIARFFGDRAMIYAINRVSGALVVVYTRKEGFQPVKLRGGGNPMTKYFSADGAMLAEIKDRSDDQFVVDANLSNATLAGLFNKYSGKEPIKKFATKEEGLRRLTELLKTVAPGIEAPPAEDVQPEASNSEEEESDVAKKTKALRAKKAVTNGKGRVKYDRDAKITILVEQNPIRESAKTHARFAAYRNGMKLSTALEKIEGLTMADVVYHIKQKWIKLEA